MPIKTVEEVIIRIIAINRDLNEESLNSLLIASGWEKTDIDNGLRVFRNTNQHALPTQNINNMPVEYQVNDHSLIKIEESLSIVANKKILEVSVNKNIVEVSTEVSTNKNNWAMLASNLLLIILLALLGFYLFKFR